MITIQNRAKAAGHFIGFILCFDQQVVQNETQTGVLLLLWLKLDERLNLLTQLEIPKGLTLVSMKKQ